MKRFRRRRFLVDRGLQLRFIAASLGYVAFYIVIMAVATFVPLFLQLQDTSPNSPQAYVVANNLIYLHRYIWPIALLVLVVVSLHSLWLSHKIAGPLYRFRQIFMALAAGKLPKPQKLRKGDYLQSEMKLINEMVQGLHSSIGNFQESQKALARCIAGIVQRSRFLSDHELTLLVEELEAQGKQLEKHAAPFSEES